jgi:hypothetical protein
MSFSFVALSDGASMLGSGSTSGSLEIGSVSQSAGARRNVSVHRTPKGFIVTTAFGVSVQDSSGSARTASLMAALPFTDSRMSVRIDGMPLDSVSRIVAPHLMTGAVTRHQLEIEVPSDITEAQADVLKNVQFILIPE